MSSPLWENAMLGHQTKAPFAKGPWIDRRGAKRRTQEILETYDVRAPGVDVAGYALSGGNQQKLIVGRELTAGARVLLANHPDPRRRRRAPRPRSGTTCATPGAPAWPCCWCRPTSRS